MKPSDLVVGALILELLKEAKRRKQRLRMRAWELRGNANHGPCRGPKLPNGKPDTRWLFYTRAKFNHEMATQKLTWVIYHAKRDRHD